jgi:hypothetical protein
MTQAQAAIPFTAAAHRYREKIWTTAFTPTAANQDLSPPGGAIKSYGYMRGLDVEVSTTTGGSSSPLAADGPWNILSQVAVTQPNGEEMFGGPTFSGFHAFIAAKHGARFLNGDPSVLPSFVGSATSPRFVLPINFEIDMEDGLGAVPNQDFSAPWKLQLTGNTQAQIWTTVTTSSIMQLDVFLEAWTVPSPQNPLNPNVLQTVAPPLLGTLNKWTVQQYAVPANSSFNVLLSRKGNAIRNLACIILGANSVRQSLANFPDPVSVRWDGTVIRANDRPLLIVDDEYRTMGGEAGATPNTPATGVMTFKMSDLAGIDTQGAATGFGMDAFWGTVQSSTLEIDGTWGASAVTLVVLTNDVQFVNLAGNPYAFAYSGYLQAPAQPSSRT